MAMRQISGNEVIFRSVTIQFDPEHKNSQNTDNERRKKNEAVDTKRRTQDFSENVHVLNIPFAVKINKSGSIPQRCLIST